MIDWTKVSDNEEVISMIQEIQKIEDRVRAIDKMALIRYELEVISGHPEHIEDRSFC